MAVFIAHAIPQSNPTLAYYKLYEPSLRGGEAGARGSPRG